LLLQTPFADRQIQISPSEALAVVFAAHCAARWDFGAFVAAESRAESIELLDILNGLTDVRSWV
jgi:hypothetical protein